MRQKILQYKELIQLLFVVGLVYLAIKFFLLPHINTPEFKLFIDSIGFWGYLIIIGYVVISHVFAPISGTPGVALAITIYGLSVGMWLLYYASLISCVINFCISRRYGRNLVRKFVGAEAMKEVDSFTSVGGEQVLFISRLLGFSFFDFISYAAGLTKISFKSYFAITAISSLITNLAIQLIFWNVDFKTEQGITLWVVSITFAAVVFGIVIKSYLFNQRKRLRSREI